MGVTPSSDSHQQLAIYLSEATSKSLDQYSKHGYIYMFWVFTNLFFKRFGFDTYWCCNTSLIFAQLKFWAFHWHWKWCIGWLILFVFHCHIARRSTLLMGKSVLIRNDHRIFTNYAVPMPQTLMSW